MPNRQASEGHLMPDQNFYQDIERFNAMYQLDSNTEPTLLGPERVRNFHDILAEEVNEGLDLATKYEALVAAQSDLDSDKKLAVLTELSDWLGDLVVYCASEAKRWGLPLNRILDVIMQSNFSKLGEDGQPVYDHRGKVMKGPGYWKPEPKIQELLSQD
jgi:predicted HAD superfamily Cof-like phosphohydrolase